MYLRSTQLPMLLVLEPIQEHIYLAPLTSLALYYMFNIMPYIFIPAHFLVWIIADYILLTIVQVSLCVYTVATSGGVY